MKKKNIFLKRFMSFWIIFSLVFIIPVNLAFSAGNSNSGNVKIETTTKKEISTVCGGGAITDVKSSLIMSIVTMCLPGILEKVHKLKQIKCETAVCYYEAVKYGLDPTFCIKQSEYRTCTYVVGELFALPGFNLIEYYRKMSSQIIANPVGILFSAATYAARAVTTGSCIGPQALGLCHFKNIPYAAAATYLVVVDSISFIQQLRDIAKNGFFPPLKTKNACDRLPQIKKEMDQIIKYG